VEDPRRRLLTLAVLLGMVLPFAGKPVHVDDANFLALARGAAVDPWRPHLARINWQGTTERAFDVLSNPPGIAWWLAPLVHAPVWALHLWMLPWLLLAAWGAWTLGERLAGRPATATLLLLGAPSAVLAAQALTPDLPLLACTLAGMAGLLRTAGGPLSRRWPWAVLLGCAALFRYSGAVLVIVAGLWPLLVSGRRGLRAALTLALAAALPLELLALHDAHAYGHVHLLAMTGFQGVADTPRDVFRKLAAALAALGGALVLPVLCWSRPQAALAGLVGGCVVGGFAASLSDQSGSPALATLAGCSAGGAVLGALAPPREERDPEAVLLLSWAVLGLLFLLKLRFTAARYWLPFFPPVVLLSLRRARPRLLRLAVPLTLALAALLALDDLRLARAQQELAAWADGVAAEQGGPGLFAGHWGWQHALSARGWLPLEEDSVVPAGMLLAVDRAAWPQQPAPGCLEELAHRVVPGPSWLPRVHSWAGAANLHASLIAADPPVETYAPWTFAGDEYDEATVYRGCAKPR